MIQYIKGDATSPVGEGKKIIIHCCNDIGAWGAGFVLALSKRWIQPERSYLSWSIDKITFKLGNIQIVNVEPDLWVCNMIGQHETQATNPHPIDYEAIFSCLQKVDDFCKNFGTTVHAPRFGAGLAGGNWEVIEALIKKAITTQVTIYDF